MGTNYVFRHQSCEHCGRHEETHVGKKSAGWSFSFRAWPHKVWDEEHPDWGYDPRRPLGFQVVSRAGWAKVFAEVPGELWDEYGKQVEDPLDWLNRLEPPNLQQRRWEDMNMGPHWVPDKETEWRDPEGFRFGAREFS